jgi:hypothetical protein
MIVELLYSLKLGLTNYLMTGITGLGKADIRTSQFLFSGRDGGMVSDQLYGMRQISITGAVRSSTCALHKTERDALITATPIDTLIPVLITLFDNTQYYIDCNVVSLDLEYRSGGKVSDYKLELLAGDPLFYDASGGGSQTVNITRVTQGGYVTPYILPVIWDSGSSPTIATNSGDSIAYPLITLYDQALNPIITNQTTGESFQLILNMVAGDQLVIDMKNHTASLNGANVLGNKTVGSIWWGLMVGSNAITLNSGSAGDTITAHITWSNGVMGI